MLPGEGLVDAHRLALVIDKEIIRLCRPPQRHAIERGIRLHPFGSFGRFWTGGNRTRKRRLVAKASRTVDGAQQGHEDAQGANGVKAVGVGRQSAHGVERDRVARH